jgi:nickel/cobalt exporter
MTSLTDLLQQSAAHAWLFIPTAILLGALHGLEPGHSKTMMAAFIIAVRGTVRQAVLLGLAATASHTLVVWIVALGGMWLFGSLNAETAEPYFQLASGALIVAVAAWMLWRTRREQLASDHHHHHDHRHHDHHQHLEGFTNGEERGLEVTTVGYMDAHEREHAEDIRRRFANRNVTTGQIVLFGLTGGLLPCPGAITVLLLCLQLQRVTLGAVLVLCFSIGLAITMVTSGVIAAISVRQVSKRWAGFSEIVRTAPYASGGVILLVGLYVAVHAWMALPQ